MRSDVVQGSQRGDVITVLPGLVWYAGEAGHRQYLCCFDLLVELYVDPLHMSITLPLHLLTCSLDAHCTVLDSIAQTGCVPRLLCMRRFTAPWTFLPAVEWR